MKIRNKIFIFFYLILIVILTIKNLNAEIPLYKFNAIKISYKDNNKIIIAEGQAYAVDQFGKEIFSDLIIYDKSKNIIKTKKNSKYRDKKGNKIDADSFLYDLNLKKIIALNNVRYEEREGNIFYFSQFEYFENSNKGFGRNAKGLMTDKSSFESEYVNIDNNLGTIIINSDQTKISFFEKIRSLFSKDNKYTTCENIKNSPNIKEQCPDWSLSTFETRHDSNKKMVYHEHAVLKIRNIPVFYTPYFSHPDPTVKRKSGFLTPSTKNFTNLGRTVKTPYFWSINNESDLTFTPIFYLDENSVYLTEYRRQNINSNIHIDTSYSAGYKNLNKKGSNNENLNRTNGSRNHFFLKFLGNLDDLLFKKNDFEINLQRVSQKNYLEINQINTNLVKQDISTLNSNIKINSYEKNRRLHASLNIFENLKNDNSNTKYQYKMPSIEFNDYFKFLNQNLNLLNLFEANNYGGDSNQVLQVNKINTTSEPKIIKKLGVENYLKTNITNINTYNEKILGTNENLDNKVNTTIAIESSYPLIKIKKQQEEILKPKIFLKHTTGRMSNSSDSEKILSYKDIYELNRIDDQTNVDKNSSIGYGLEYSNIKQNNNNEVYLTNNFSIGQIINSKKNYKMPAKSSLQEKSSDIVGNFNFFLNNTINKNINSNMNNKIKINYEFNIANQLNSILKNDLNINYEYNNNTFKTNYYELNEIGSKRYIDVSFQKKFSNELNISTGAKKNLKTNKAENNFIETFYESDCFKIGLNLSKQFYTNSDVSASNNLNLYIILKPFGQPFSPDLANLVK